MSFRLRLTVLVAAAVAVAIVGASVVVYYTDRSQLMSQVDSDLSEDPEPAVAERCVQRYGAARQRSSKTWRDSGRSRPARYRSSFRARKRRCG